MSCGITSLFMSSPPLPLSPAPSQCFGRPGLLGIPWLSCALSHTHTFIHTDPLAGNALLLHLYPRRFSYPPEPAQVSLLWTRSQKSLSCAIVGWELSQGCQSPGPTVPQPASPRHLVPGAGPRVLSVGDMIVCSLPNGLSLVA